MQFKVLLIKGKDLNAALFVKNQGTEFQKNLWWEACKSPKQPILITKNFNGEEFERCIQAYAFAFEKTVPFEFIEFIQDSVMHPDEKVYCDFFIIKE